MHIMIAWLLKLQLLFHAVMVFNAQEKYYYFNSIQIPDRVTVTVCYLNWIVRTTRSNQI